MDHGHEQRRRLKKKTKKYLIIHKSYQITIDMITKMNTNMTTLSNVLITSYQCTIDMII